MLEHRAPLDFLEAASGESSSGIERPDLRIDPVCGRGILLLQSASVPALREALAQELGLALPAAGTTTVAGGCALLWLTPAEWLLELPGGETDSTGAALRGRLASSLAAVTDLSDALLCVEVSGSGAADALMSGCSLDLRPHAFVAGRVVRTALADVPVILWNPGDPARLRCWIDRSFAAHFLAWLEGTSPP